MRTLRPRFTVRWLMVAVAALAVPLWILGFIARELDRIAPRDAATWARQQAAYHAGQPKGPDGFGRDDTAYHEAARRRYARLAEEFRRLGVGMGEATLRGPFTDHLPAGQGATVQIATRAIPFVDDGSELAGGDGWPIPAGTACVVEHDRATDPDDCSGDRQIHVRLVDGDHAGELVVIERIYLRRRP